MKTLIGQNPIPFDINKRRLGLFLLVLFQLSALIGVSLGHVDWFISKTPFNLALTATLLVWINPVLERKGIINMLIFFSCGMFVEIMGVNFGWFFGDYSYGNNLGVKLLGVPLLIGVNWAILVLVTGVIANKLFKNVILRVVFGAFLMVFLDWFIEVPAPIFDFWTFDGGTAPLLNYIGWFVIACILHSFFQWRKMSGDYRFSLGLYLCQLLFFGYFYFYFA